MKMREYKICLNIKSLLFLAILTSFLTLNLNLSPVVIGAESKKSLWDVQVKDVNVSKPDNKKNVKEIKYELIVPEKIDAITAQNPVWIFVKFSPDGGKTWMNTDDTNIGNDLDSKDFVNSSVNNNLSGDVGIVETAGKKVIVWNCGKDGTNFDGENVLVKVRAIEMCKIPSDKSFKLGGNGAQAIKRGFAEIKQFFLAKYPATYDLYVDFLNEMANFNDAKVDSNHQFWCKEMAKEEDGGLEIHGEVGLGAVWSVKPGRERWPAGLITYWVAHDFALWVGLALPTEPETEKAARNVGGTDGVKYSWGNTPKPSKELCNFSNFIKHPTDVRAYEGSWARNNLANQFGLKEMTGNVWEWQDTYWYDGGAEYDSSQSFTKYNVDTIIKNRYAELDKLKANKKINDEKWLAERKKVALKGWRVIKGGSYFDGIHALDASSRIVGDTKVRHSAVGCRFIKR